MLCRVIVHGSNKRTTANIVGRMATVVNTPGNGWVLVNMADTGENIRIQQRYLSHAADGPLSPRSLTDRGLDMDDAALSPDLYDGRDAFDGVNDGELLFSGWRWILPQQSSMDAAYSSGIRCPCAPCNVTMSRLWRQVDCFIIGV